VDLRFGNGDAVIEMLGKITRREGFGNTLAEGSRRAANIIGNGSEKYTMQVKGMEIAAHDPRAFQGGGPHYAATITGGRHTEGITIIFETGANVLPELGIPDTMDRAATEGKGRAAKILEDWWCMINTMGWCLFSADNTRYAKETNYIRTYNAVTGLDLSVMDGLKIGERIFNLRKAFNMMHGCTRAEDTLPERLLKEPSKRAGGAVVRLSETLPEFYQERGWDPETSKPTRAKLNELGLDDIAQDLWGPQASS
jgi:aldehyde:ferredoxin oxidoreductase